MIRKPSPIRPDFTRKPRASRRSARSRSNQPVAGSRRAYSPKSMYLPIEPRTLREPKTVRKNRSARSSSRSQHYDIAFNLGRMEVRTPGIHMPSINFASPRWLSGLATIVLVGILYLIWNLPMFTVSEVEIIGNQRISAEDISLLTGIIGEPIFKAVPTQIETNLRHAFPDLSAVDVHASLPGRIVVKVTERIPVIIWFQDGDTTWIDMNGMAFKPRGEVSGLVQVIANGAPREVHVDPSLSPYEGLFINPEMVQLILAMAPYVPEGILMIYDPTYGIGWQDARGWAIHFGRSMQDMNMKLAVYQILVDRILSQGIQPTLISMEYLDAPFYK